MNVADDSMFLVCSPVYVYQSKRVDIRKKPLRYLSLTTTVKRKGGHYLLITAQVSLILLIKEARLYCYSYDRTVMGKKWS